MNDMRWLAYQLATAYHETAYTMKPIKEYGKRSYFMRMYDKTGSRPRVARSLGNTQVGDGARFCGRGYVQLTGRANYKKMSPITGYDLVTMPGGALMPEVAAEVMHYGMKNGTFTGKRLSHYFNRSKSDWYNARRIINGTDRASTIARYGRQFHDALVKSAWDEWEAPVPEPGEGDEAPEPVKNPIKGALKRSSRRADAVRRLQTALGGLIVDGDYGPVTERAVKEFQKANGLKVDGKAGQVTLGALGLA